MDSSCLRRSLNFVRAGLVFALVLLGSFCHGATDSKIRAGVIRWDPWYKECDTRKQVEKSLMPEEYNDRRPWFSKKIDGKWIIPDCGQDEIDLEINWAADAGLDYFLFIPYSKFYKYGTLSAALDLYLNSAVRSRIDFSIIVMHIEKIEDRDNWTKERERLVDLVKRKEFLKLEDGRKVVFFWRTQPTADYLAKLRDLDEAFKREGLKIYRVWMGGGHYPDGAEMIKSGFAADAVSAYGRVSEAPRFADLAKMMESHWEKFKKPPTEIIPCVTAGWNKEPRKKSPVDWEIGQSYHTQTVFTPSPTNEELETHTLNAVKFIKENPASCQSKLMLIYAWNEFDEGGWIMPTWTPSGPDTSRLQAVKKALETR